MSGKWNGGAKRLVQVAAISAGLLALLGVYDWVSGRFRSQGVVAKTIRDYEDKVDSHITKADGKMLEFELLKASVQAVKQDVESLDRRMSNIEDLANHIDGQLDTIMRKEGISYRPYTPQKGGIQP